MEPIASSIASQAFRTSSTSPEVSTLLRDGRMIAAEVLSNPGDGTVMLAIGRHVIPAETDLRFEPGARFLLKVEQSGEDVILRLLGDDGREESSLLRALRAVVGEERPLGELFEALRVALARDEPPETPLARGLDNQAHVPTSGAALKTLLLGSGLAHEALLAAWIRGNGSEGEADLLRDDPKALLLRALRDSPPSQAREAARHALAGLEAEQLLNLARERMGEALVLSLPFFDGLEWTTARLLVPPRGQAEEEPETGSFRIGLGLELSRLGLVRADLVLTPSSLVVRVLVTDSNLVPRLKGEADDLSRKLGDGRRRVLFHVREGTQAEVRLSARPLDIRFLREHRLMNVAG